MTKKFFHYNPSNIPPKNSPIPSKKPSNESPKSNHDASMSKLEMSAKSAVGEIDNPLSISVFISV